MEILIYVLALGLAAGIFVPLFYNFIGASLPASISGSVVIPSRPTGAKNILVTIIVWGAFLTAAIWLLSLVKPIRSAIQKEA